MFVANRAEIFAVAKSCPHNHDEHCRVRMADGTFFSRLTAEYPPALAQAFAEIIAPYLSTGNVALPLESWTTILPTKLQRPTPHQCIEDGGGLPSSAFDMARLPKDPLESLCSRWFKRLSDTKQCLKVVAALQSGCKEPPLSKDELAPYVADLLETPGCPPGDHLLHVPPGQPFSGSMFGISWHHLLVIHAGLG